MSVPKVSGMREEGEAVRQASIAKESIFRFLGRQMKLKRVIKKKPKRTI